MRPLGSKPLDENASTMWLVSNDDTRKGHAFAWQKAWLPQHASRDASAQLLFAAPCRRPTLVFLPLASCWRLAAPSAPPESPASLLCLGIPVQAVIAQHSSKIRYSAMQTHSCNIAACSVCCETQRDSKVHAGKNSAVQASPCCRHCMAMSRLSKESTWVAEECMFVDWSHNQLLMIKS